MSALAQTHRFTTDDYYKMAETGILSPNDRVELIRGEIVEMSPIGTRHAACVRRLNRLFSGLVGENALIAVQDPIHLDEHSEPEPDLTLLRPRADFYAESHPTSEDILLLIEVSDSSLLFDRSVKLPLYARHGIREVWVVNLVEGHLQSHREPERDGYRVSQRLRPGDRLTPQALQDVEIDIDSILH